MKGAKMGLLAKTAPLLARIWRRTPQWLRGVVTWTVAGKVIVGVSGVLLADSGQILLLSHRFHRPGIWGMPGGWLAPGETIFDCWRREVSEELALDVAIDGILCHRATRRTLEFFLLGRISGGQLTIDPVEIVEARFFSVENLPPMERFHLGVVKQAISRRLGETAQGGNDQMYQNQASDQSGMADRNTLCPVSDGSEEASGVERESLHG